MDLVGSFSCCNVVWWNKFLCERRREQTGPDDEEERSHGGSPAVRNLKLIDVHNREASVVCGRGFLL